MKSDLILSALSHTWILDLDGTLVKHNGYIIDSHDTILPGVSGFLLQIPLNDLIIILTSRTDEYQEQTKLFLRENNIRYNYIIFNVPYGERIIVNDDKPSGLEMAKSICTKRDAGLSANIIIDNHI